MTGRWQQQLASEAATTDDVQRQIENSSKNEKIFSLNSVSIARSPNTAPSPHSSACTQQPIDTLLYFIMKLTNRNHTKQLKKIQKQIHDR